MNRKRRKRHWFDQWIREGYSVRQLVDQSQYSQTTIRRIVDYWLTQLPTLDQSGYNTVHYLICDGTFIHRPISVLAAMDGKRHTIIDGVYGLNENNVIHLHSFLQPLRERGLTPKSCTIDGNPQMIRVLREVWPHIIIQRCLVHVQRQGLMWCRHTPKRTDAKHLRDIFLSVMRINTREEQDAFLHAVSVWEERFGKAVSLSPEHGRVFSDIRRARSMLMNALPDMFHYLDDRLIPRTTNSLEGYFSRLKDNYPEHRGLAIHKRFNYFKWYFYLKPK